MVKLLCGDVMKVVFGVYFVFELVGWFYGIRKWVFVGLDYEDEGI